MVGTAADTHISPRSCSSGYLRTYTFLEDGAGLELLHKVGLNLLYFGFFVDAFVVRLKLMTFLLHC